MCFARRSCNRRFRGRAATLLVLTTVVPIFREFSLEFAANIGKWQLKGLDILKFNDAGKMIEFEVMIRPNKALAALVEEMGNRIGPQLSRSKQLAGVRR